MKSQGVYKHYVVASATFPNNENEIVTARLISHDTTGQIDINPINERTSNNPINLRAGADTFDVLNIQRYNRKSVSKDLHYLFEDPGNTLLWSQQFSTDYFADIRVADIGLAQEDGRNIILFSGTTAGHGEAFGDDESEKMKNHNEIDGFLTKLDAETGNVISSVRLQTLPGYSQEVRGMCIDSDQKAVYVVGSIAIHGLESTAEHKMDDILYTTFITRIDLTTMQAHWSRQITDIHQRADVHGRGCSIETDPSKIGNVYLSGIVKDGGQVVNEDISSFGNDDVFVAYYKATGQEIFRRQMGTKWNDRIINTQTNWVSPENDNTSQGGVIVSTATDYDGSVPAAEFDGVDYVFQVSPINEINVMFGDLDFDTHHILSNSLSARSITSEMEDSPAFFSKVDVSICLFIAFAVCIALIVKYMQKKKSPSNNSGDTKTSLASTFRFKKIETEVDNEQNFKVIESLDNQNDEEKMFTNLSLD